MTIRWVDQNIVTVLYLWSVHINEVTGRLLMLQYIKEGIRVNWMLTKKKLNVIPQSPSLTYSITGFRVEGEVDQKTYKIKKKSLHSFHLQRVMRWYSYQDLFHYVLILRTQGLFNLTALPFTQAQGEMFDKYKHVFYYLYFSRPNESSLYSGEVFFLYIISGHVIQK